MNGLYNPYANHLPLQGFISPENRIKIYELTLQWIRDKKCESLHVDYPYLCIGLKATTYNFFRQKNRMITTDQINHYFPELWAFKPEKTFGIITWWDRDEEGIQQRKTALIGAIALCKPENGIL